MTKSEIGQVITVVKGATPQYQVRLSSGSIVVVEQPQIQPPRMTLLPKGSQLRVTHALGIVQSASTDLELAVLGKVEGILKRPDGIYYQLVMDQGQGKPVTIKKDQVTFHPERDLSSGAVLEVQFTGNIAAAARLVSEQDQAVVIQSDALQASVTVRSEHLGQVTVRLKVDVVRAIKVGAKLGMEILYNPHGERKVTLRPATTSAQTIQPDQKNTTPAVREGKPQFAAAAQAEAEILGIDAEYLARVKKDGHRFEIISFLEQHARDGLIEWYRLREGRVSRFAQPRQPLAPLVQQAVQAALPGFKGFFQHQARALDAIRAEHNLVVVTQTASGKTLCYNPAIFEYLLSTPQGHILYLFPLNALMMDQKEKIDDLVKALSASGVQITVDKLHGGMGTQRDEIARRNPHILATNPEMLSVMLNEAPKKWAGFFGGLKYIVIDEVHTYRGMFGIHMSGLVRRLLLTTRRMGADPHIILSSATVSNPLDLATRLTSLPGASFELLDSDQDGSQQASKHWVVLNPDWGSRSPRFNTYQEVAAEAFVELLTRKDEKNQPSPLHTILFCRSIREVKTLARLVDSKLGIRAPLLRTKVKSYVSAELTIEAKRDIYDGLRSERYLGVISTNALEAGIDIGSLDACIIAGFPFSVMAMRQMAGRVGRKEEGLVLFIPHPLSSLDQYYRDHPEHLIDQPPEVFVVDPTNAYIARKHINAAAFALGGLSEMQLKDYWGERFLEITAQAQKEGAMHLSKGRWMGTHRNFNDPEDVYAVKSIRSNTQVAYAICPDDGTPCQVAAGCFEPSGKGCPRRITLLDRQYVYRDCHPGAIYEATDGRLFRVTSLDDANRVVRVKELPDDALERTYVEADLSVEINGAARGKKSLLPGVELAWGNVTITRLFTGYFRYTLQPARRCRHCRREFDETIPDCPHCHRPTEVFYHRSTPERMDFPAPHQMGFRIVLKTVACWLTVPPELESHLDGASPCKLPGDRNRVQLWLKRSLNLSRLVEKQYLVEAEKTLLTEYHTQASQKLSQVRPTLQENLLFPGVYSQCLLAQLRARLPESRALELYQGVTGYPVTDDLRHICRKCQTSALFTGLHTLEHAVDARYPSIALGDRSDIGAYTTLGHIGTGQPTVFWFDNYEGGLGAAEKIYEHFTRLLEAGLETLQSCTCTTLEGCPRCTYIPDCSGGNDGLNKLAGIYLIARLLGITIAPDLQPFLYLKKRSKDFERDYRDNEYTQAAHGVQEEAPAFSQVDPYQVLRLQQMVHSIVVNKAYEIRAREIDHVVPPLRVTELNDAYRLVLQQPMVQDWRLEGKHSPYEVLEVLPSASLKMIQQVYRTIALQVHPDANPTRTAWANEMMKALNDAYDKITKEHSSG